MIKTKMDGVVMNLIVVTAFLLMPMPGMAGNLDSHVGSGMPTTVDIYNRLDSGAVITTPPGLFQEPVSGATVGSGRTLSEIQSKLPVADTAHGAATSDVFPGKTFWGLRTDGTWGLKIGTMAIQTLIPASSAVPAGYYAATNLAAIDADLVSNNIKSGVTVFGVNGSVLPSIGTAPVFNVLAGITFSNSSGTNLVGTMPNNGAVFITPGTTPQSIAAGYHDGTGTIAGTANLISANIRSGVSLFGISGTINVVPGALAGRVPKTGQTQSWCYVPCTNMYCVPPAYYGSFYCAGTGQDGHLQYGIDPAVEPTSGVTGAYNTPAWTGTRFTDNADGTVIDNLTGLIWLKNIYCSDAAGTGIKSFNWEDALAWSNGLSSGSCGLSDGSNPGDWRIPNINELHSLGPTWPPGSPFVNLYYWSSTGNLDNLTLNNQAYYVYMNDGYVNSGDKRVAGGHYALPVRGGH